MAVRFDAEADGYSSTVQVPDGAYTVTWWGLLSVDRNLFSTMWEPGSTSGTTFYTQVSTETDGVSMGVHTSSGGNSTNSIFAMALNTWYCFALTQAAANGALVFRYGTDPNNLTVVTGGISGTGAPGTLRIGRSVWAGEWFNGRIASFKHWSAVLTPAEIALELRAYGASRKTNLVRRHDFKTATGVIDEGTGGNLTGTGATTEAGPDIPDSLVAPAPLRRRRQGSPIYRR